VANEGGARSATHLGLILVVLGLAVLLYVASFGLGSPSA
jgi:hypothetical protein